MSEELKYCPECQANKFVVFSRAFQWCTQCNWSGTLDNNPIEDALRKQLEVAMKGIYKAIGYGNRMDIYKVLNATLAEIARLEKGVENAKS